MIFRVINKLFFYLCYDYWNVGHEVPLIPFHVHVPRSMAVLEEDFLHPFLLATLGACHV